MSSPASTTWLVAPVLGESSETWIDRQIAHFSQIRPHVLTWQDKRTAPDAGPIAASIETDIVPGPPPARRRETAVEKWRRRLVHARSGNFFAPSRRQLAALDRIYDKAPPDTILAHFGHTALCLQPFAARKGIPIAAHFHGDDLSRALKNRWYAHALRRTLPRFQALVVVGHHQRRWLLDQGVGADRIHVIPCGAPLDFRPSADIPQSRDPTFLCVSRLVRQKGVHVSLSAFAEVHRALPAARLRIIGEGSERRWLERQAHEMGLQDAVTFLGSMPADGVCAEMDRAWIFLQHSLEIDGAVEGFGVSIAEAAAMRLPVVATRSGGIPDQVIDGVTGFLVAQTDAAEMAERMLRLATCELLRRRMGQAGRDNVLANFETARQVAKLERVLLGLSLPAGGKRKRSDAAPEPEGGTSPGTAIRHPRQARRGRAVS